MIFDPLYIFCSLWLSPKLAKVNERKKHSCIGHIIVSGQEKGGREVPPPL